MIKQMAQAVLLAQRLQEQSFDEKSGRYTIDYYDAAVKACKQLHLPFELAQPVYLLNYLAWNDIQDWANENN